MSTSTPPPKKSSVITWVALGLSVLGFIFAVIPGLSFVAWPLIVAAFVVSIIALAKKAGAKAFGIIALILSIISGIVAPIVSIVAIGTAINSAVDDTTATVDEATSKIGDTVTTATDKLAFTVTAVTCGQPTAPGWTGTEVTAQGQFCKVDFSIKNDGTKEATLFPNYVGGLIGDVQYAADDSASVFATDSPISTTLNPGLSVTGTTYIDIPAGKNLDAITFTEGPFGKEISILNK